MIFGLGRIDVEIHSAFGELLPTDVVLHRICKVWGNW